MFGIKRGSAAERQRNGGFASYETSLGTTKHCITKRDDVTTKTRTLAKTMITMKKINHNMRTYFTRFITILILLLGVGGSAWGDTETYTFTSKSWAATNSGGTANWTSGKDGNALTSGRGIQVTASTSGANGTSPITFSGVSQVVLTYSTNADKGAGSIAVQIGSNTASSQTVTKTGGTSDRTLIYNFSPNQTGKVKVTVTCTTNSIYVKSVAITYAGSLTPSTFALSSSSSVTLNTVNTTSSTVTCNSNNTGTAMTGTSSNESVATFTSTANLAGTINAVGRGTCKITLNQAASSTIAAGGPIEINVTVKGPSDLSVTSPLNVYVGGTASISKSTNSDGAMSYTSTNTSVATVNSSGVVTGVAVGSTTISVSQTEGSLNLASDTKTVTVNVTAAPAPTIYTKVTDASALEAGKKILIVYESGSKAFGVIDNSRGTIAAVTISSNQISLPANNSTVDELILGGTTGAWTLKSSLQSGNKYLSNTSSTNIVYSDTYGANNQKWDITISGGNASIENKANTGRYIRYTTNTDPASFRPYTSGQSKTFDVAIYMEAETGTAPTFTPSSIDNQTLVVGATYETLAISVNSAGTLSAESADEDVATVSWNNSTKKATVTAVAEGETTIKIKATANGDYLAGELPFTVNVVAPTISLNKNSTSLEIGGTEVLTATTTNAGGATINWSSSDGSVILSDETGTENTITGVSIGSSTITASLTVNNIEYSASCEVTIMSPNTVTLKDENGETMSILTQTSIGVSVTLPSRSDVGEWIFVGWSPTDVGTTETSTSPGTIIPAGSYVPTSNIILYPVYTRGGEESLAQTLQYDDWSYSGTTTDKDTYRLFHTGSYIESNAFDLSTLSKVIVYGGTYGGDTNNSLTIGDGSNTWKDVMVSGKSQTGINTYTDGIALTGTNSLRITSNSGSAPGTGVRISKVEIFVTSQTYFIRKPGDFVSIIYNKVTSTPTPADWAGTYLIVYEAGSLAMNGGLTTLDASGNSIGVTIADDKIIASATVDAASFNIASIDGVASKYSILSRSGYYIGRDAGTNGLNASTNTVYQNSLSVTAGVATITGNGGQELRYNYASNNLRFRYYSSDSSQQPIALYKREEALKPMTTIFWGTDEKFLVVNQHWTNSITTNNTTGTKTYSSSNPSVASVDSETGEVVAHAVGTVTITVVIDETESYASGSSSYTLRVIDSNARYYRPVANKAEIDAGIAAGKKFIIATKTGSGYVAMGEIDSDKKIGKCENLGEMMAVPIEDYEMKYLIVDDNTEVNEFTLTKFTDAYSFKQSLDNSYLSHANTDPAVHKIYTSATNSADYQKFYLTYTDGAWAIVNKGTPNWYLQYNTSSPRFCCYINSQVNPMIFMEGLAVAAIGDDFAPDGVWTGETETLSVSVTPVAGYSSGDYTTTWTASNSNITITNATEGAFRGDVAGELEVTILVNPIDATVYSPIAKTFPMVVTGTVTDRTLTLYHETFGDNPDGARDWNEEYSVKSGVEYVYSGIVEYTISNAKQSLNTEGFASSGLNQTTKGTEASIIIGPLNVEGYTNLIADYQWKAGSVKGDYYSSLSYSTTGASGSYTEVTGTGDGTVGYTKRSYSLPAAAQVSTLYLKIVFNTSNTQALIDEVNLSGYASTYGFKVYEGSSKYSMLFVPKISPTFPTLKNNEIAVIEGLTNEQKSAMPDVIKQTTNVVVNGNAYHLKVQDKVDGVYSPFYAPELLTTASKVSYARTAKEWNSLCLPFSLPFGKVTALFGDGAEIYQLTAVDANCQVVFTKFESGTIAAGTPVLVKSVATSWNANELAGPFNIKGDEPVTFTPVGNSTVGTAELLGSYKEIVPGTVDGSQLYKLMSTASGQCFGKLSATGKVYPFRIYLKYTPPTASSAPANLPVKIHVIEGTIGDLNKDKMATLSDLTRMINMVNGAEEKTNSADLDGDGDVNGVDVNRLAKILTKSK